MNKKYRDTATVARLIKAMTAIKSPLGRRITNCINDMNEEGIEPTQVEIMIRLRDVRQESISMKIKHMNMIQFIDANKIGKFMHYKVNHARLNYIANTIKKFNHGYNQL